VNRLLTVTSVQKPRQAALAPQATFLLERSDNFIARHVRDFSAFFNRISDPQNRVFM